MKVTTSIDSEAIDFGNRHVLYVEGDKQSLDAEILKELLGNILWIQPLGPASSIRSVAESLHPTHPSYYFLIDRDYHIPDARVEGYWKNFPDPKTSNLLIWRRKELENYFLEPSFLVHSRFCKEKFKANDGEKLKEKIVSLVEKRLYLDAANYVIVSLREEFKGKWIEIFSNPGDFSTEQAALDKLTQAEEFKAFSEKVSKSAAKREITKRFQKVLAQMLGGQESPQWNVGSWLSMVPGKRIFSSLVNHCFQVKNVEGKKLNGKQAINAVAKDLLRTGQNLPGDFVELRRLIHERVQKNIYTVAR